MPLVSVIIPVYNTEKYIRICLDSVINQTLKNIEIICVDDGSTDNSLLILQEYSKKDPRVVILQQNNKGGGAARNFGLNNAKGKYVAFLDSDDYFDLLFLEKLYSIAEDTSAELVVCQYKSFNTETLELSHIWGTNMQLVSGKKVKIYNKYPPHTTLSALSLVPWNKLYLRRMLLENNINFQEVKHYNDNYFAIVSELSAKNIAITPDVLVYYRIGMKTNTQSRNYQNPYEYFLVIDKIYQYLISNQCLDKFEHQMKEFIISGCITHLKKLRAFDCHSQVHTEIMNSIIKKYGLANISIKKFQNKLAYMYYLKLINYSYSQYLSETGGERVYFLLKHPYVTIRAFIYLVQNILLRTITYGVKDVCQFIKFTINWSK